jgi:hypothetical protein
MTAFPLTADRLIQFNFRFLDVMLTSFPAVGGLRHRRPCKHYHPQCHSSESRTTCPHKVQYFQGLLLSAICVMAQQTNWHGQSDLLDPT